jgi:hypothetical protein
MFGDFGLQQEKAASGGKPPFLWLGRGKAAEPKVGPRQSRVLTSDRFSEADASLPGCPASGESGGFA